MAIGGTTPKDSFVYETNESKRDDLPQLRGGAFLTDCGLEASTFQEQDDTYHDAAFMLLRTRSGRQWLKRYYRSHVNAALSSDSGFILETPTLRAHPDWAWDFDVSMTELEALDSAAVELARAIAGEFATQPVTLVISGCIGSRHDDRTTQPNMTIVDAMEYHGRQVAAFARARRGHDHRDRDGPVRRSVGIVRAARVVGMPVAVSFSIGGDGRLPTGRSLGDAITTVDAATGSAPVYYAVRCEHPNDAARALDTQAAWVQRVRGLSVVSSGHADEMSDLVRRQSRSLLQRHSGINVLGGGTTSARIEETAKACAVAAHAMSTESVPRPWSNHSWVD